MSATLRLDELLEQVNKATASLRAVGTVPDDVARLIDSFEGVVASPLRFEADPYLVNNLFAAAFLAEKGLRHDDADQRRRAVRLALEQFRQALRDIVANRSVGDDQPVRDVLVATVDRVSIPQAELAQLFGVSSRQLQRWLSADGPTPAGDDEARVRIVAQVANQLRHVLTGPGVAAWFNRKHPTLNAKPIAWLDDPLRYPALVRAATSARAMTA